MGLSLGINEDRNLPATVIATEKRGFGQRPARARSSEYAV